MDLILKIFDQGHGLGLMNNLVNYFGLNMVLNELCKLG